MRGDVGLETYYIKVQFPCLQLLAIGLITDDNTDNADDGETAAGGCLAHLLQILVCVSYCETHVRM